MKFIYQDILRFLSDQPSKDDLSKKLFQLGHEHEIDGEIFDVEIDSLGLVNNYKEEFIKIIINEGFDALLKKMRTQLKRLKK